MSKEKTKENTTVTMGNLTLDDRDTKRRTTMTAVICIICCRHWFGVKDANKY